MYLSLVGCSHQEGGGVMMVDCGSIGLGRGERLDETYVDFEICFNVYRFVL